MDALTDAERAADALLSIANRERAIAQSAATTTNARAPLPAAPAIDTTTRSATA